MTENADVEWLRNISNFREDESAVGIFPRYARRLLAHIDQLEAEVQKCRDFFTQIPPAPEPRPTVHEIAVQMMAALVASDDRCLLLETLANESYRAAEALVAEGRRRDG